MPVKYATSEVPAEMRVDTAVGQKCEHAWPTGPASNGTRCTRCGADPATDRQINYIESLLDERMLTDDERTEAKARISKGLDKRLASAWITRLLELPKATSVFARRNEGGPEAFPKVEDGRYAIMDPRGNIDHPTLMFYRVKIGKESGRWAGFTFLDAGRGGAHGDLIWTPIKNPAYKRMALEAIAKDPLAAGMKFGQEVGKCSKCGRSLTQDHTRARGYGDDCAEKMGLI